ncbi:YbjQ family protein [Pelagibius sp. Alg239-R121]|uniref:YbjQ family protein n=1 Tax=Pelagibius sp. Alg239-R121 TaxID=2993448 RepID=UPI0024A67D61|nr:heavy metal-binding domain-containing protein [Pelagibius sp. Alg239-R121]
MGAVLYFVIPMALLAAGLIIGTFNERRHYKSIQQREEQFQALMVFAGKSLPEGFDAVEVTLVSGGTVVAEDRFKALLAWFRNIIGGRIKSYENLLERGRREAVLRMKEKAAAEGFSIIVNTRFETARISQGVEIFAYGTAAKAR